MPSTGIATSLLSTLNKFRLEEKRTDLKVECGNRSFNCHKLILAASSEYFDTSLLLEDHISTVVLKMEPVIFEEILDYLYTGQLNLTSANFYELISASELLRIDDLYEECIEFMKVKMPENALDVFLFSHAAEKRDSQHQLCDFIIKHLNLFFKTKKFLELSPKKLLTLLDQWSSPSLSSEKDDENDILNALIRWFEYSRTNRMKYFDQVVKIFETRESKEDVILPKFLQAGANHDLSSSLSLESTDYEEPSDLREAIRENETSLHALIKYRDEITMKTFSLNRARKCTVSCEIPSFSTVQHVRCVDFNNSLYCLHINPMIEDSEYLDDIFFRHEFRAYPSIEMQGGSELRHLPFLSREGDVNAQICAVQNNGIYLYHTGEKTMSPASNLKKTEIKRNIYLYNIEVNDWFSVPEMKEEVNAACLVSDGRILYLLGGECPCSDSWKCTQTYDYRERKWRLLPPQKYEYDGYFHAAACEHKGRIYVFKGGENEDGTKGEVFDTVAGKWDEVEMANVALPNVGRVVSYAGAIWLMGKDNLDVNIYQPVSNEWSVCSSIKDAASKTIEPLSILEAFVFKNL